MEFQESTGNLSRHVKACDPEDVPEAETITTHYLAALGVYRGLYIPNWIYRFVLALPVFPVVSCPELGRDARSDCG